MEYSNEMNRMVSVCRCHNHGAAPIPQEGHHSPRVMPNSEKFQEFADPSSVGACGLK